MTKEISQSDDTTRVSVLEVPGAQLASIVHAVKLAVISVDETQTIILFNPQAEAIFRCTATEALGGPLERFIPVSARATHRAHVANFDGSSEAFDSRAMGGDRILAGLRANGEEFPIEASISKVVSAGRKIYTVILRDVTERVRAEEDLRRYLAIFESSADAIVVRNADGAVLNMNAAAEHLFGYIRTELIGMNIGELYSPNTPPEQRNLSERAARGEAIVNFETVRRRKDGSDVNVAVTISPVRDSDGRVTQLSAIYRDITEQKRQLAELNLLHNRQRRADAELRESRDQLRELSSALQTIREEEKTRIARELHDELGQSLTALKMDTAAIASELDPAQEALLKRTHSMKQLIDATVASVRRIAADLRPVMLDNLGLAPTLDWLVRDFATRSGVHVDLDMPDEDLGVNGDAATAIFRIIQEALTNVARHASASEVVVEVKRSHGGVVARVRDNGKGMATPDGRKARSFGLLGMRERAYVLGGNLTVSSTPNGGTLIEAVIPIFGTTETIT